MGNRFCVGGIRVEKRRMCTSMWVALNGYARSPFYCCKRIQLAPIYCCVCARGLRWCARSRVCILSKACFVIQLIFKLIYVPSMTTSQLVVLIFEFKRPFTSNACSSSVSFLFFFFSFFLFCVFFCTRTRVEIRTTCALCWIMLNSTHSLLSAFLSVHFVSPFILQFRLHHLVRSFVAFYVHFK